MVQENIEEQIIAELAKLKNATEQIEKAKAMVVSSNQSFTQIKEQYEVSKKEWEGEKSNIIGEIENLRKQLSTSNTKDNLQEELSNAIQMWKNEFEHMKNKILALQNQESKNPASDFSYSAMNKMFEQFVDTRTNHLEVKITRERKDMAQFQQKQIDSFQETINSLKKQNRLLWIFVIIILIIAITSVFIASI